MRGLEEGGPRPTATPCGCVKPALETGNLLTEPVGYLESCFSAKNGTPRQPSICSLSRACLKIRKSIFNNPEHSLMGLDQFSHVWILFVFHKNGRLSCKAKVQPPRLNGAKTGVFSTRSPHRPNAIGLTLAKLEKVEGGAIYLSGIDMIHGTPVLDIKPYIADYDSPQSLTEPLGDFNLQGSKHKPKTEFQSRGMTDNCDQQQLSGYIEPQPYKSTKEKPKCLEDRTSEEKHMECDDRAKIRHSPKHEEEIAAGFGLESRSGQNSTVAEEQVGSCHLEKSFSEEGTDKRSRRGQKAVILQGSSVETQPGPLHYPSRAADEAPYSMVPAWVREAPVTTLEVRFTPHAEMDLRHLSSGVGQTAFKYFQSAGEAKCAIEAVLSADPRSVYRRKLCQDRLFYFTVDIAHVTCWFGDGFAEVLRIQHASEPVQMNDPADSLVSLGS
ncbi:tRNA (adenine(37)-N6)-methyltransferase isoform X1 [Elephas maximus indicus]|uniref:tRNA (adenine(37)-N6)-methyltransferase isoform X1 n=2 Tax=Elephas maximus indicus TaxID=99487 RepID=UPI0021169FDE|nr:tRNA (adenine(37)-N6)-methyltransferase isoform X1 [Elephas maximus indicus]